MRTVLLISVFFIMLAAETVRPARALHTKRLRRFRLHLVMSLLNTFYTRLTCWALLFFWVLRVEREGWGVAHLAGLSGALEILLTVAAADFFEYIWHRLNHQVPFLWRFHRMHHTDRDVDLSTALRFHPVELTFSCAYKAVWVLFWGPSLEGFLLSQTLITVYSMFHHSNMDLGDAAERIVSRMHMTPRLHTAHHTVTQRTRNANYATILIVWDKLFRTLKAADAEECRNLGVPDPCTDSMNLKEFFLEPFSRRQS